MLNIILIYFLFILIIFEGASLKNERSNKRSEFETPTNATNHRVCFHPTSHSINSEHKAFGPPYDLLIGLREGLGAMRGGWEGSKEETKR
jgi:hypothetical protein